MAAAGGCTAGSGRVPEPLTLLVGSYSESGDSALCVYDFDPFGGSAAFVRSLPVDNASFAAAGGSGVIYALSESGETASAITALRADGEVLGRQPVGSAAPCYVAVSPDGRFAVTANYTGGTVAVFPIASDGSLGPRRQLVGFEGGGPVAGRQDAPHPHCISFTPDGRFMLVDDLGTDRIHQFAVLSGVDSLVASEPVAEIVIRAGSGPRHIIFNASGDKAYLLNELSDEVTALRYDGTTLTPVQYIAADTAGAGGAADIRLSADGRHLYASLRLKHDGIVLFDVDPATGNLTRRSHTPTAGHPRNFTLTPDGRYMLVACRDADAVQIFAIDPDSGAMTDTGRRIAQPRAVFVSFLPPAARTI